MRPPTMICRLSTLWSTLALAALLIGGCGAPDASAPRSAAPAAAAPTAAPQPTAAPHDELYIRARADGAAERLAIVTSAAGALARDLPLGAVSPDWSTMYEVEQAAADGRARTRIQALDLHTSAPARETTIEGAYVLPSVSVDGLPGGLSPNGRWLTLRKAPGQPVGPAQSQFVVLDTAFAQAPRRVDLDVDGPYEFDGIDNSGNALYLIQYLISPSARPAKYQVRYYNLAQGALDPQVIVAKGEDQVMAGTHHTSLATPDGTWRYSLYMNNQYGPFIHALSLNDRFAICVDLPKAGKDDDEKQMFWTLVMSADGKRLYAANGALGLVSKLDISQNGVPQVLRTAAVPAGAPAASAGAFSALAALFAAPVAAAKPGHGGVGAAALSADGTTLFVLGERGLLAIDTSDLSLRGRYLPDMTLSGLAVSSGGGQLYVVNSAAGTILQVDPATGQPLGQVAGVRQPWSVLQVVTQK